MRPLDLRPRGLGTSSSGGGQSEDGEAMNPRMVKLGDRIVGTEQVTLDDRGPGASAPRQVTAPREMKAIQKGLHWLTHLPYDPGYPICVQSRRPNNRHLASQEKERIIPLMVGDYTPLRDSRDDDYATLLVLKVYPFEMICACAGMSKGPDPMVVARLCKFIMDTGLLHFAYRSDQEPSIIALIRDARTMAGRNGAKITVDESPAELEEGDLEVGELQADRSELEIDRSLVAVPEHSHPGESQSNGLAERTIQEVVDQARTLKLALESRLKARLPCYRPVFAWLIEHTAYVLNRFNLGRMAELRMGDCMGRRPQRGLQNSVSAFYGTSRRRSAPKWMQDGARGYSLVDHRTLTRI